MKEVKEQKISIRSIKTGTKITDDFYIQVNRKFIHISGVATTRVLQILKNATENNLDFICKNFQIKQLAKGPVNCMFCKKRTNNYFIYGNSDEKRNLCVCKKHLPFFYDCINDLVYNGNCTITSNKTFKC